MRGVDVDSVRGAYFEDFPVPVPGIYFLVNDGVLSYVGSSTQPERRVCTWQPTKSKAHTIEFDRVFILRLPHVTNRRERMRIELAFMRILNPLENGYGHLDPTMAKLAGSGYIGYATEEDRQLVASLPDLPSFLVAAARPAGVRSVGWSGHGGRSTCCGPSSCLTNRPQQ